MMALDDLLADDGVGLWRWSEAGDTLEWSAAMFELHGRDASAGVPDLVDWLVQLEVRHGEPEFSAIVRDGGEGTVTRTELLLLRGDGVERYARCTVRVRCATPGQREVVGAMHDTTAMTRLRGDLSFTQSLARIGSYRWDAASNESWWSDELYQLLGYTPGEVAPSPDAFLARVAPQDLEEMRARIYGGLSGEALEPAEHRYLLPDGEIRHAVSNVLHERDSLGRVVGLRGVLIDVTERVRIAESLRSQAQELEAAQTLANVGTWVFDTNTGAMRWSDEMFRIYGLSPETFVPTVASASSVIVAEDRESVESATRSLRTQPRVGPYNYRIRLPSGEIRHLVGAARLIRHPDGVGVRLLGTALDVTPRVALEARLLHAQKLEGLGRLAGGVAHDFNNALTAILANADAALLVGTSGVEEELREITNAALHASELTRQLLTFARRDASRAQRIAPNDAIASFSLALGRLVGEDIEVAIRYAPEPATVLADPGRLEQVLLNLVVNARDAMPDGGALTIETTLVELDAAYVARHVDATAGRYVRLDVGDTGTGMSEETQQHLFEPFFTTKPAGLGTGLGLATCYGIVRQAGGHVTIETELGVGTTFSVFLPLVPEGVATAPAAPPKRKRPGGSETILVAEDDLGVRRVLLRTLRALGYTVVEAVDGLEAIERARSYEGVIHLMLSDVVMPRMRGPEAARTVRELRPGIHVLFITGYAGEYGNAVWDEGPVLGKPFTPDALAARIRELLDTASAA